MNPITDGTIVWIGPVYNRSGYGLLSRAWIAALHHTGCSVKVVPVNDVQEGVDDSDMDLIHALTRTPIRLPTTAIFCHVPSQAWLDAQVPQPCVRIMVTAFEGVPPANWINICNQMDQVWLNVDRERETWINAGLRPEIVRVIRSPHPWTDIPLTPRPYELTSNRPFRFLSNAMFLPRRRWDVLIRAYLEEFAGGEEVELYLRVLYPEWHPVPGQPRRDLHALVERLRQETGSQARVIIDEELGTRMDILRLTDACDAYVSTDVMATAPVGEAMLRQRLVLLTEESTAGLPAEHLLVMPVARDRQIALNQTDLQYHPHHQHVTWPALDEGVVRAALRRAYEMPGQQRQAMAERARAALVADIEPDMLTARALQHISEAWTVHEPQLSTNHGRTVGALSVIWEGSQFVHHSLALVNRELCLQLIQAGHEVSVWPYERDQFSPQADSRFPALAQRVRAPLSQPPVAHVRHQWPPNLIPPEQGHWVMIQPWEFGSLPRSWITAMDEGVDELWTPSRFVRDCYIESGLDPERVHVVPNGVDSDHFNPSAAPMALATQKHFKFLFVGGTIWRKGPDVLLDAYLSAFTAADDVCLVIKDMGGDSFYKGQTLEERIRRRQKDPYAPEIIYLKENLNPAALPGLYTACHCLVHPYRGEGFGLPIAEAMACGLPVVVTGAGAALDFCDETNAYLIPATRRALPERRIGELETVDAPWVFEPDAARTGALMRYVYEHQAEAAERGRAGQKRMAHEFTWAKAAERVLERLKTLQEQPIRRFASRRLSMQEVAGLLAAGEAAVTRGDLDAALREFRSVAEAHPDLAAAHTALASTLMALDRPGDALGPLRTALKLAPTAELYNQFGVALYQSNDRAGAEEAFLHAADQDKHAGALLNLIDLYHADEDYERETAIIKRAVAAHPENVDVFVAMARTSLELGMCDAARSAYERIKSLAPQHEAIPVLEEILAGA